jgi:hypothetical protein
MFFTASWKNVTKAVTKTVTKTVTEWSRVFTKGFTAENIKIPFQWNDCAYIGFLGAGTPPIRCFLVHTCAKEKTNPAVCPVQILAPSFHWKFVVKNLNIFSSKSFGKNP